MAASLVAGVDAVVALGQSKALSSELSPVGRGICWGGLEAAGDFLSGRTEVAALKVLAGTVYLAAHFISENFTRAATKLGVEVASEISALVPMAGVVLQMMLDYGGSATGKSDVLMQTICSSYYGKVDFGTGPGGAVKPCDLFGPHPIKIGTGETVSAVECWSAPNLLKRLDNERARFWTYQGKTYGVPKKERTILRGLREGIAACYDRPDTDGGAAWWILYVDFLRALWLRDKPKGEDRAGCGRERGCGPLHVAYLEWLALDTCEGSTGSWASAEYDRAKRRGWAVDTVLEHVRRVSLERSSEGKGGYCCEAWEVRPYEEVRRVVVGWDQMVDPIYQEVGDKPLSYPTGKGSSKTSFLVPPPSKIVFPRLPASPSRVLGGAALGFLAQRLLRR